MLRTMTKDEFKCLIFVCALQSPRDAEIRTRLLNKIKQDPDSTLQALTAECQWLKNLKHDSTMVEQPSSSLVITSVYTVTHTKSMSPHKPQDSTTRKTPTACCQCGAWAFRSLLFIQEARLSEMPQARYQGRSPSGRPTLRIQGMQ
uniref:Uncharacterized protein n=1 Tax=Schistocephalus solidus TaxID=70667 RepID=A0A0X3PM21_SCHSO